MTNLRNGALVALAAAAGCATAAAPAMEEVNAPGGYLLRSGPPGSVVDVEPPTGTWTELSLIVDGPAARDGKRDLCLKEARAAGIRLRAQAPLTATLSLSDESNRVSFSDGRPARMLGQWKTEAVCRVALAAAVDLDRRVAVVRDGKAPGGCRVVGSVDGHDTGYVMPFGGANFQAGSYESAVAAMQFAAVRMGSNVVTVDLAQQVGNIGLQVSGRAFACDDAPSKAAQVVTSTRS